MTLFLFIDRVLAGLTMITLMEWDPDNYLSDTVIAQGVRWPIGWTYYSQGIQKLRKYLPQSKFKSVSPNWDKHHAIDLELGKILYSGLIYYFFKYQLEDLYKYIDEIIANRFICSLILRTRKPVRFILKLDNGW